MSGSIPFVHGEPAMNASIVPPPSTVLDGCPLRPSDDPMLPPPPLQPYGGYLSSGGGDVESVRICEQALARTNISDNDGGMTGVEFTSGDEEGSTPSLEELMALVKSDNPEDQFFAAKATRKILSMDTHPPIDEIISTGIVPMLVRCLQSDSPLLQFEAVWILNKIVALCGTTDTIDYVVQSGAVPLLVQLLNARNITSVTEQALSALGTISADDGPECRAHVLGTGIIDSLLSYLDPKTPPVFLRKVTWTLSNLFRIRNPSPPFESVCKTLPALVYLVQNNDVEVKVDALWALSFLADGQEKQIQVY